MLSRMRSVVLVCLTLMLLLSSSTRIFGENPLVSSPTQVCYLHRQPFECGLLFDWHYYVSSDANLQHMTKEEAFRHWRSRGGLEGRRGHSGRKVLKVVLMSKDDWPLLRSTVIYHAHVFGGKNLYVLDSSTLPEAKAFLREVQLALGVNVIFTPADLNHLEAELNFVMRSLMWSADILIKLDTDEFIALDDGSSRPVINSTQIAEYLDSLVLDGTKLATGYWVWAIPNENCDIQEDPVLTQTDFDFTPVYGAKNFFAAWSFEYIDLGSHINRVRKPFNNSVVTRTRLILIHYHWQCYEKFVEINRRAVLSHKYFKQESTVEEQLRECRSKWKTFQGNSGHKVQGFCSNLENPAADRAAYLRDHAFVTGPSRQTWKEIAVTVQSLLRDISLPERP